jgi:hypothetical protein
VLLDPELRRGSAPLDPIVSFLHELFTDLLMDMDISCLGYGELPSGESSHNHTVSLSLIISISTSGSRLLFDYSELWK